MRRLFLILAVAAVSLVGAVGMAVAEPTTYEVTGSWQLTYIDGKPTVVPEIEDDVMEVKCRSSDQMTDWRVNKQELVGGSWPRTDGTGIQVQPKFTGQTETIIITVSCRRS